MKKVIILSLIMASTVGGVFADGKIKQTKLEEKSIKKMCTAAVTRTKSYPGECPDGSYILVYATYTAIYTATTCDEAETTAFVIADVGASETARINVIEKNYICP